MDATQAISDSILESEEEENEEESQNERGKPLAKLCILRNPHIPEKEMPLFLGHNVLGRDPNICTLGLLAPSVSKQHAAISISAYRRRGHHTEVDTEALVWDLGSMNGTRKGRLKLTPNVRYALSEGDTLVLGNIPCRYVNSSVDCSSSLGDTETLLCRHSEANARLSDSSNCKRDDVGAGSKIISSSTKARTTPVKGDCLPFGQTPIHSQGTLVQESDSDSEGERGGRGSRKQKIIVSDSDSHKSSPSSSVFLSPPIKVVPDSEDESTTTPSFSSRNESNRRVSFSLEKTVDLGRQGLEKNKPPAFVENGEEEAEGEANGEESRMNVKREIGKNLGEDDESLVPTSEVSRDVIPEFNLDSDTDVEGGEEEVVPAGQSDQPSNTVLSHMDSDTDVDEDVSDKVPTTSFSTKETAKCWGVFSGIQLEGITMDSDTDVEDEADASVGSKATLRRGAHIADSLTPVQSGDFHLDSDTDVDEEEEGGTEAKRENPKADESLSDKSDILTPAAFHNLHPDSNPCDKAESDRSVADLNASSESDTDLEEDPPAAAATDLLASSATAPGALEPGSDVETDADEPAVPQMGHEGEPADFRMESDTDVEDEEDQIPHLQREYTPGSLVPVLQNCSTPVQFSGQIEQMETQAFTSSTSDELQSFIRPVVMPSCSDSQEDEDYAVAETQSFILQTKDCHKGLNPNSVSEVESSAVKPEDQSARGDSFQLGLSDSSHLHGDPRALAMENTQAFVPVDGCVNLEDTQAYAESISAENDPNLEATQPYVQDEEPARCSEMSKKEGCVDLAFEATQAYISEPYDDGGSDVPEEDESLVSSTLAMAETQPMSSFVEACNPVCSSEPVTTGAQDGAQEHQEELISEDQSVPETQPMNRSDNEESNAEGLSLKPAEEQKHPRTSSAFCLAETQPMHMSDGEESSEVGFSAESLRPARVEIQPVTSSTSSLAETQPLQQVSADETQPIDSCDYENDAEDSEVMLPRKRKAKQLYIDEEESQQHKNSARSPSDLEEEDSMPSLRKRKAKPLQLEDETQSLVGSQFSAAADEAPPSVACEVEESSQDITSTRKRKAKPLYIEDEQTQPLISSEASFLMTSEDGGTKPIAACEDDGALQEEETKPPLAAAGCSALGAHAEGRDGKSDADESVPYPRKRRAKQLHLEEERAQLATVSVSDRTKVSPSTKERKEQTKSEDEGNREEVEVANQRTRGRRNTRKQEEDNEVEKNKRNKNEGQIRDQGDLKLYADSRERGHVKTETEELINEGTSKGKERIKETQPGSEIKEQKETNLEKTKTNQDGKTENEEEIQENQAGVEKTECKESQENKGEARNPKGSVKGRRAARRTTTAVLSQQNSSEDFPARRTRSRSNSSNSVSSERSVSTVNGNTQENKVRGRGAKRICEPPQTAAVRSSRRRTTAAAAEQDNEAQGLAGSSELSSTGTRSQIRGRPQGRGTKTLFQADLVTAGEQKASRSSTRALQQDDKKGTDALLTGNSRGQRRVSANVSDASVLNIECLQSNQEKASADLKSPMPKRSTRDRGPKAIKTEHVEEAETPTASDGCEARSTRKTRTSEIKTEDDRVQKEPGGRGEQKEKLPAGVQGGRTSRACSAQVKKSEESFTKKEAEDGKKTLTGAAGRRTRGRTTLVQKNKTHELQETPTSGCSMDQDRNEEESEVPTMTPSRKRRVSSNSSPVAKATRSSSASPATVGRLRAGSQAYKVLFTGVVDESGERVLPHLGGAMAGGISDMTCLVTDKVRRTVKFLCAVAKGVPVVTTQWLEKSGKAGSFLPPHAFIVKDPEQEEKFNFSLEESLRTASTQPLLQGYEIHVTKSVKPEPVHMKDIIACSGAKFLPKMPTAHKPQTVVISCEEDLRLCGPATSASLPVVTAEFILTGILQQRVDFQTHALSPSATNLQPPEGRGRSRKKT